ncbi:MAG: sugar phosphate isomerase/epimerase [Planctomycetaceae bacterium]|nr:sugar phosphate isomerase/epimerase [Planctomycetaceae bacterium]
MQHKFHRRRFLQTAAAATFAAAEERPAAASCRTAAEPTDEFRFRYLLGSCMYGYIYLDDVLAEVSKTGARHIDIWPKRHGNQREQWEDLGNERFRGLLERHSVKLGCITQYKLGPFGLQDELRLAGQFDCQTMVTGGSGPKNLKGAALKKAVADFVEKMKPHVAVAEEQGVTIAIENHANNLIDSPDSLRYLAELRNSDHLAIALAPYHLPQDSAALAALIRELGDAIEVFYAWEHGDGCMVKLPKERELKQLPGRGPLDFRPLVSALVDIQFQGWTEIFMHPVPRGVPILETPSDVTAAINTSRRYLEDLLP